MKPKPTILLIDDNDDVLDLLEVYLYNEYTLITAQNGFEGLKVAEREMPALIITDIMMPVMDGIRFFNELRRREPVAAIPVIAVTSFVEQITVKSLNNMGFKAIVFKPFQRDAILAAVAKAIEPAPSANDR
jgi:CheY-like chemotaxis protein